MKNITNILFIVTMVAISRLVPHWPNLTAVGASAIWMAYAWPQKRFAILIPLLSLFVGDLVIGFHDQMLWVYGATFVSSILILMNGSKFSPKSLIQNSIISSLCFFIISNFGVWMSGAWYPKTAAGLTECFVAALPFAVNDLVGTMLYGSFGLLVIEKAFAFYFTKKAKA